jgi:hypothetical protein
LCPQKTSTFPHFQKKFQKITIKIDIVGTHPNFQLSPVWTMILSGLSKMAKLVHHLFGGTAGAMCAEMELLKM